MAGSGDMMDAMINLAAEREVLPTGSISGIHENRSMVYKNSDNVFVMPSVSEPFGIAPLEAMHVALLLSYRSSQGAERFSIR